MDELAANIGDWKRESNCGPVRAPNRGPRERLLQLFLENKLKCAAICRLVGV
jgi:hypothetical protein